MEIGDRVFNKESKLNGIVVTKREPPFRDTNGVEFFNPSEEGRFHNLDNFLTENKGLWCRDTNLIKLPSPSYQPRISLFGSKSPARLIRRVCEIPKREVRDRSFAIINLGVARHRIPQHIFLLNRRLICNKYHQCSLFHEKDVSCPNTWLSWFPNSIRKPIYSFGGNNITDCSETPTNSSSSFYFQKKIDKIREFRAHVFLWNELQVPYLQEKTVEDPTQLCWNKHQGGKFRTIYSPLLGIQEEGTELIERISSLALNAVKAIRYDFGGVDILMDRNSSLYVIEINARCGVKERSLAVYKTVFLSLQNLDVNSYKERRWENE